MGFRPTYDVYLANALFSEADQAFNNQVAARLRAAGLSVFLPQETGENRAGAPTGEEIFVSDAQRIARSRVLLAVLDGDVLDDGVACEIGLAFGMGVPVVGLWTDLRRFRTGEGRIYRNIFVTGAIERNGTICSSTSEAVARCAEAVDGLSPAGRARRVAAHYAASREVLADALSWIRTAYRPAFDPGEEIIRHLQEAARPPSSVLDVGAGEGWLGKYVADRWPAARYVPIDPARPDLGGATLDNIEPASVDAIVLAYVLHDVPDAGALIDTLSRLLRPGGHMVILDVRRSARTLRQAQRCSSPRPGLGRSSPDGKAHGRSGRQLRLEPRQPMHRHSRFRLRDEGSSGELHRRIRPRQRSGPPLAAACAVREGADGDRRKPGIPLY